ncbi:hypothetical protein B0H14DRAFT_3659703 [Mycena olivaceomarginata]|nr:hypothetical protein B0H14DRAFT_3659703 [Mycena olivaceomarginata]
MPISLFMVLLAIICSVSITLKFALPAQPSFLFSSVTITPVDRDWKLQSRRSFPLWERASNFAVTVLYSSRLFVSSTRAVLHDQHTRTPHTRTIGQVLRASRSEATARLVATTEYRR